MLIATGVLILMVALHHWPQGLTVQKELPSHVIQCSVHNSLCIVCRVAQLEDLTFKEQMAVYAESQVVIMTHGAALGNVLFMSPVSHFCCCCITLDNSCV